MFSEFCIGSKSIVLLDFHASYSLCSSSCLNINYSYLTNRFSYQPHHYLNFIFLNLSHYHFVKMRALTRNYCYWKSIYSDIETVVKSCKACCDNTFLPWKLYCIFGRTRNWQRVHITYAGHFLNRHFLIVVDASQIQMAWNLFTQKLNIFS